VNATFGAQLCVLTLEHFGKVRNAWKIFEMPCWRRMEKITLIDSVKKGKVVNTAKEERIFF
jgi:hypothetical protein